MAKCINIWKFAISRCVNASSKGTIKARGIFVKSQVQKQSIRNMIILVYLPDSRLFAVNGYFSNSKFYAFQENGGQQRS